MRKGARQGPLGHLTRRDAFAYLRVPFASFVVKRFSHCLTVSL
jgi:hypothetical protein